MKLLTFFAITSFSASAFAQGGGKTTIQKNLDKQVKPKIKYDASIVDEDLGIDIYEPLNMFLAADSVRACDGYNCDGWVTDYYKNGEPIHKGFYVDGQLKVYKNFYPDGQVERDFITIDNYSCSYKLYYPDGTVKSKIKYINGEPIVWSDFYEDGSKKFYEQFHKSMTYHIQKKSFYKGGQVQDELVLLSKKKLNYDKNLYHQNGQVKVDGNMFFNKASYDYTKTGTWKHYNADGKVTKELVYNNGRVSEEKKY